MGAKQKGPTGIAAAYLLIYNLLQFSGWGFILYKISGQAITRWSCKDLWQPVSGLVALFQTLALLEVLHCLIKIVPSSAFLTFQQISSRLYVVWMVLYAVPETHTSRGVPMLLFAWCIAEIIRYLYYVLSIAKILPSFVVWCRYTFFIVLYPVGVTGELLSIWASYPYIRDRGMLSYPLPNRWNFSFHMHYLVLLIMLVYIPVFPQLYGYMLQQRKKVLNPSTVPKKVE